MKKTGFTLVEVLIAIVLVALAVASIVGANISFTQSNGAGTQLSTAEFLSEQIKEMTAVLPLTDPQTDANSFGAEEASLAAYDDLDDFDGKSYSPPINAARQTLNEFPGFTQQITVENVSKSNFESVVADHGSSFARVTVKVLLNSKQITSASWIRTKY